MKVDQDWRRGLAVGACVGLTAYLIVFQGGLRDWVNFTISGVSIGAVYAIAASGLVVTYTTSGIFNFAHGAFGMLGAFTYWQLLDWGVPVVPALIIVLLILAPLFGAGVERLVMGNLGDASEITKLVVTIGLLAFCIGLANTILWPPDPRPVDPFFGANSVRIGDVNVTWHELITIGVAFGVALGLRALLFNTRTGVAMRAVVDDRPLAQLNGGRPGLSAMLSWALGTSLAALAGILLALRPTEELVVIPLTLLVVQAYAAAVFGRLQSLPLTFIGALVIGLAQTYAAGYIDLQTLDLGPVSLAGLKPAIPVILLFLILVAMPGARLRAGAALRAQEGVRVPTLRTAAIAGVVLVALVWLWSGAMESSDLVLLERGLATGVIMLSLVPLTGYGGRISLAALSFAAIGVLMMNETSDWTWLGGSQETWVGLALGAFVAALVGAVVALPALRLEGIYLALATAAFAVFMDVALLTQEWFFGAGIVDVPRPRLGPVDFESNRSYAVLLAAIFAVLGVGVIMLRRGPFGRRLYAMNDSQAACATLGLDLTRTKVTVFALSAAIAAVGGALLGGTGGSISREELAFEFNLPIVLMAVVGGISLVSGALFGGLALEFFGKLGGDFTGFHGVPVLGTVTENFKFIAPGLLAILLARRPNGVVNMAIERVHDLRRRRREKIEREPDPIDTIVVGEALTEPQLVALDRALGVTE